MLNKYNKNLSIIILGIALVVYILFMAVTGRVFDVGKSTIAANTNEDTEYTVGRISNDREYSIVVDKKVSNLKSISLKIKDLREKYISYIKNKTRKKFLILFSIYQLMFFITVILSLNFQLINIV